jgi:hypothetical protein
MELGEVLLDPGVGEPGQRLGPQTLDRGSELAHGRSSDICSIAPNIGSILVHEAVSPL